MVVAAGIRRATELRLAFGRLRCGLLMGQQCCSGSGCVGEVFVAAVMTVERAPVLQVGDALFDPDAADAIIGS
ncbi:hypothetical protein ACFYTC_06970 [Actinomadura nitritigenes]|uniref:hypothetical protein n=1 Tax=Actinomadura nitritigenes TaxID=134602 RepID=UPI0036D03A8E